MIVSTFGDGVSKVCGGIYSKTLDYFLHLVRTLSSSQDIVPDEMYIDDEMYPHSSYTSASTGASSSSVFTTSNSTSSSAEFQDDSDFRYQKYLVGVKRRSTSLIEQSQAKPVNHVMVLDDTEYINTTTDGYFDYKSTNYLNKYVAISDTANIQLSASVSDTALIYNRSTTNLSRTCLLYTSPSPRDATLSRMPSSA
mgnify:CR=1 FL=1